MCPNLAKLSLITLLLGYAKFQLIKNIFTGKTDFFFFFFFKVDNLQEEGF